MCVLRKMFWVYYGNLNQEDDCDNKKFWRTVKSILSGKEKSSEKNVSVEDDKILTQG